MGPCLFSGAENTLETKRQVQDRPIKAAEPVLLLQIKQVKHEKEENDIQPRPSPVAALIITDAKEFVSSLSSRYSMKNEKCLILTTLLW